MRLRLNIVFAVAVASLVGAHGVPSIAAEGPRSSALAKQFTTLLAQRHLEAFAARDPQTPDRFVAALAFPDVQLLVVAGRYSSPEYLQYQIDHAQYREAYTALYSNAVAGTKLFFQDLGSDGLRGGSGGVADILYERGTVQTLLDGNWKKAGLSEAAYDQKLQFAEAEYCRVLTLLIDALGQQTATPQ